MNLEFARRVQLYSEVGRYLRDIDARKAAILHAQAYAIRMCAGRIVRAMKLVSFDDGADGARGPRLSSVGATYREHHGGKTQRPTVSYSMRAIDERTRTYAPPSFRPIYLAVLESVTVS